MSSIPGLEPKDVRHLQERVNTLKRCFELCEVICASIDLDDVLVRIMTTCRHALAAETCSLLLADGEDGDLVFTVAQGPVADKLPKGHKLQRGAGFAGWVQENGLPVLVPDAYADPRFNPEVDHRTGYRTRTLMCVPLMARNHIIGVAQVINKQDGGPFNAEDLELFSLIGAQASIAIDNAHMHQAMLAKQRMEFDMEIAASIQRDFMPQAAPIVPGFEVAGRSVPCDATGGDYFDYLLFPDLEGFGLAVGDVTGHGIPAALLMASVRAFLRARCMQPGHLGECISDVNRLMSRDTGDTGRFMTLFCLQVDTAKGQMRYVKAGHDPALVFNPETCLFSELDSKGIPLGIEPSWKFTEGLRTGWQAGEVFVLGTDGIWECHNHQGGHDAQGSLNGQGEMYGKERMQAVIRDHHHLSAQAIVEAVLADVEAFRGNSPRQDDVTLVVLKALAGCDGLAGQVVG